MTIIKRLVDKFLNAGELLKKEEALNKREELIASREHHLDTLLWMADEEINKKIRITRDLLEGKYVTPTNKEEGCSCGHCNGD
jgi:hypothetical protein